MNARLTALCGAITLVLNVAASAQNLEQTGKALNLIADFADRMCTKVPLQGNSNSVDLSIEGKVEVSKLLKALTDLGVSAAGKYKSDEYQGVLQKDLKDALKDLSTCKQGIFKDLKDKVLPATPPSATIYPKWSQANFYAGTPPRNHAEFTEYRNKIAAVRASCAKCIVQTDRTQMIPPGNRSGFTIGQLAPGSVLELDATQCPAPVRYQLTTQQLSVIQGAPPAVGSLFAVIEVQPGVRSSVELGGQHGFTADPVQCL
jgi:hypothetical protein